MKDEDFIKKCAAMKGGLQLIEPSENLYMSYMRMARESLASMNANVAVGIKRWAIVAAYYSRYHALYALFSKIGIKCEVHDCTIAAAKLLLNIKSALAKEIDSAKIQRINMQYYADRTVTDKEYAENIKSVPSFVLEVEKLASGMTSKDIGDIRKRFESLK
jgi:uncharacterized protein (UPF0332 family)